MTEDAPFQELSDRLAGYPVADTLYDGAPGWLHGPLQNWLDRALENDDNLARRVLLRLRRAPRLPRGSYVDEIVFCEADQLLTVIDAVLQLHAALWQSVELLKHRPDIPSSPAVELLHELESILTDGGSRYTVDVERHRLAVRVDPTVTEAVHMAIAAHSTAGDHLQAAWGAAYGLHPDPDKACAEAVKAVEAAACSLVLPTNGNATLGTVRKHLQDAPTNEVGNRPAWQRRQCRAGHAGGGDGDRALGRAAVPARGDDQLPPADPGRGRSRGPPRRRPGPVAHCRRAATPYPMSTPA